MKTKFFEKYTKIRLVERWGLTYEVSARETAIDKETRKFYDEGEGGRKGVPRLSASASIEVF